MQETITRNSSIDLLKSAAIFGVIAWHFFYLHTPFLYSEYNGLSMFLQAFSMKIFQICVPLFCLCTGYLNGSKTSYNKTYIKNILKVLISYLFFSIVIYFFRSIYMNEDISLRHAIGMTLRFNMIQYGWYIEMWIGLYLLTPLFNKALNNCTKKEMTYIAIILYILTSLPNTFNRYGFYLFPAFWSKIWPITYFVVGKYIKEYGSSINIKSFVLLLGILIGSIVEPLLNIHYNQSANYEFLLGSQNENILIVPVSIAAFLLLINTHIKNAFIIKTAKKISNNSLDMYLCCWMYDIILYPFFLDNYYNEQDTFWPFFFVIIPLCFIFSYFTAWIKNEIFLMFRIERVWREK